MGAYYEITQGFNLTDEGDPDSRPGSLCDLRLIPDAGRSDVAGRLFLPEEDKGIGTHIVRSGHHLWQSRFGASMRASWGGQSRSMANGTCGLVCCPVGFATGEFAGFVDAHEPVPKTI